MTRPNSRFFALFCALLLAALPLAALLWQFLPGFRPQDALARRWQAELPVLEAEELALRMRQLARLGEPGLPIVAKAVYAEKEEIADAALAALEAETARWHTLERRLAADRARLLARELAAHAALAKGSERRAVAGLAVRLLAWSRDLVGEQRETFLADCESLLRAGAESMPEMPAGPPIGALVSIPHSEQAPLEPIPDHEIAVTSAPRIGRPRESLPRRSSQAISEAGSTPEGAASPPPGDSQEASFEQETEAAASPSVRELDNPSLMRRLHAPSAAARTEAERELARRGYSALRIEVARRLTNPDPGVRRELAELLPQMSGLDARPYLLWLCEDPDEHVRRTAAGILATSNDPELKARLRGMAPLAAEPRDQAP